MLSFDDALWSPTSAACIGTSGWIFIDFPPIWVVLFSYFLPSILTGWELCSDLNEGIYYIIVNAMDHASFLNFLLTNLFCILMTASSSIHCCIVLRSLVHGALASTPSTAPWIYFHRPGYFDQPLHYFMMFGLARSQGRLEKGDIVS